MEIYGAAVADKLDNGRCILNRRFYRQHCTPDFGSYTKDLTAVCSDLNRVNSQLYDFCQAIFLIFNFLLCRFLLSIIPLEHIDVFPIMQYQLKVGSQIL